MDNFYINVVAEGRESLRQAMAVAFAHNAPGHVARSYRVAPMRNFPDKKMLVFRWLERKRADREEVIDLPFKLDPEGAVDFAVRWLEEQDFGKEPDHDGDNGRAWNVFVEGWGNVDDDCYAICAVAPAWAMYGK